MKYLFVFLVMAITPAYSQEYALTVSEISPTIYLSQSGIIISTDLDCLPLSNKQVVLDRNRFTYTENEPYIVSPNICTGAYSGCVDEPYFAPYVDYHDVSYSCSVLGVIGLSDFSDIDLECGRAMFDKTSKRLYLYNTEIWENLQYTQVTHPYAQMKLIDGVFIIEEY